MWSNQFRKELGIGDDDVLVLQPTRVVARKGIEHSIELVRRLGDHNAKLIITHEAGDEGHEYAQRIREFADIMDVKVIYAADRIADACVPA